MTAWALAAGDFTTLGGMDRANHALAKHLALNGRDVHLVAHRVSPDLHELPAVHVRAVARPLGWHLAGAPLLRRAAAGESSCAGDGAVRLANGGNADWPATWAHYVHAAYAPDVRASIRTRASAILGHGYYLRREAEVLRRARTIVCNSRRTAEDILGAYGIPAARLHVVYYGSDGVTFGPVSVEERASGRDALGIARDRSVAVFAGALGDRRKGFDLLFDAWCVLASDPGWNVELLVAGAGAEREAWMERAAQRRLDSHVRFLGFRPDIAAVLAASDVLVHPARYEAYGLSVHEAICRGVPAIVTRSAGVAERYPRALDPLLLPNPPTVESLVAALRGWQARREHWRTCVAPLGEELRSRSWDDMAAEIVALLEAP